MHPTRKRRLIGVLVIIIGVGAAAGITTWSLNQNMLFFVSPSDVAQQDIPPGRSFRLGGLVMPGTVKRAEDGLQVEFMVTDGPASVPVRFDGILPDLFREGQGIIARGAFDENRHFTATEVLAKHDENYMPPEVADALEKTGHTMGGQKGS
ncbi:MAG: cytochrome c maturation protein CcmE [Gammaproteobacteria bacterium]